MHVTITSMDELTGLGEGEKVILRDGSTDQEWTRWGSGLVPPNNPTNATPLDLKYFVGYVNSGTLRRAGTPAFESGGVYTYGSYTYLVVAPAGAHRFWVLRFRQQMYHSLLQIHEADLAASTRQRDFPMAGSWLLIGQQLLAHQQQAAQPVPDALRASLHRYAEQAADDELDELLTEAGIGRSREHTSDVTITGSTTMAVDADEAYAVLSDATGSLEIDEIGSYTINWTISAQVTREGVGCTCEAVTRTQVQEFVPSRVDDFEWQTSCSE